MASEWIEKGCIHIMGISLESELTADQKYALIKNYYASPHFDTDQKKHLKEMVFEKDESDKGKQVQLLCEQSLPDPEQKERIWTSLTDFDTADTL